MTDCNGRSTLFDGVPWLHDEPMARYMCVFEAPGEPGVYVAELDLDRLRTHNKAIQKSVESYRITPEQKEYLKTLKIK